MPTDSGNQQSTAGRGIGDQDVLGSVNIHGDLNVSGTITPISAGLPSPIGADGTVLTANSGTAAGADWESQTGGLTAAANPPASSVLGTTTGTTGSVTTRGALEDHAHGVTATSVVFGATIINPVAGTKYPVRVTQAAYTAVSITAWYLDGGSNGATVNVFHGTTSAGAVKVKAADLTIAANDTLVSANADQNTAIASGHLILIDFVTIPGAPTLATVQLNCTYP